MADEGNQFFFCSRNEEKRQSRKKRKMIQTLCFKMFSNFVPHSEIIFKFKLCLFKACFHVTLTSEVTF